MKFGIRKKFLTGFLLLSLLPLIGLSLYTRARMDSVLNILVDRSRDALTDNTMSLLEARAKSIAIQVEQLLSACVDDLNMLSTLPVDSGIYLDFAKVHQRSVWHREESGSERRHGLPLYVEVTFADIQGHEEILIQNGVFPPGGRDVSKPFLSRFGRENYFNETMVLEGDDLFVSHLTGYHQDRESGCYEDVNNVHERSVKTKNESLDESLPINNIQTNNQGKKRPCTPYRGIIRFAKKKKVHGICQGVVSLALDHRHLMEFTQHVLPFGSREVLVPSYKSGNYAFMFDNQGWMITHPKPWDIRGSDANGFLVDPISDRYSAENMKAGLLPFNLLYVPFVHENYPHIAKEVIAGRSGVTQTASVRGIPRVLAYAPVAFHHGVYKETGCFGGVTLGARTDEFYRSVTQTWKAIDIMIKKLSGQAIVLIGVTAVLVAFIALFLAGTFTRPIVKLTEKVNQIRSGNYDVDVRISSGDELEILGRQFMEMGCRLKAHEERLIRSMNELKQHVDLLKSIHGGMLSSLLVFNGEGRVLSANPRAADFFGLSQDEMLTRSIHSLLTPFPELMALTEKERQDDGHHAHAVEMKLTGGKPVYLETSLSTIRGAWEQEGESTLLIFRDVTRRKRMEKHISRSDKLVSLGILAAGIAHEIRNPLTGITLMLDDLHDRIANKTSDRLLIQRALEEIEKLENIVTRLLEFASKPAHAPVLEDINRVVADTLFFVKKQCKQKGVILETAISRDLPRIYIDRERIRQAILNIVLNALNVLENEKNMSNKEGEEGQRSSGSETAQSRIVISTTLSNEKETIDRKDQVSGCGDGNPQQMVMLSISDNGPGIAKKDIDAIFDPFFSHNPDGFGLGLSITHTIVEEHGGRIVVESEPGRGATFHLYLPVV